MFKHKIIEMSVLVNTPATSLNRDINGAPKTVIFGGKERARFSSQSLKYVIRKNNDFNELAEVTMSERTCDMPIIIWEKIKDEVDEEYGKAVISLLRKFGTKSDENNDKSEGENNKEKSADEDNTVNNEDFAGEDNAANNENSTKKKKNIPAIPTGKLARTQMLIVWDKKEIEALAEIILDKVKKAGSVKSFSKLKIKHIEDELLKKDISPKALDVAFFGRMVSSKRMKDVPASVHIAHAFSTNRVNNEIDFFTAVDDHRDSGEGAGIINNSEYNASCYFKYGVIDLTQMYENLQGYENWEEVMKKGTEILIKSFCEMLPGGKQASYAGYTLPSTIMIEIKDVKKPFNPCNAFEVPVSVNQNESLSVKSAEKLVEFMNRMDVKYATESIRFWFDVNNVDAPKRTNFVAESTKSLYKAVLDEIFE